MTGWRRVVLVSGISALSAAFLLAGIAAAYGRLGNPESILSRTSATIVFAGFGGAFLWCAIAVLRRREKA